MELSKTIGTMAVVLGVVVAAGFAVAEDQQQRREHFEQACSKPLKTHQDREACRAARQAL